MSAVRFPSRLGHRHKPIVAHVLRQRQGVPYEVEQRICSRCGEILHERPLRRAAA